MAVENAQKKLDELENDSVEHAQAVHEETDAASKLAAGSAKDLVNLKRKWQAEEEERARSKTAQLPKMKMVF